MLENMRGGIVRLQSKNKNSKIIFLKVGKINTVEPGYNDIGLYDTSPITSDILWYQLIRHC
jgi:hypothetical protein